MNTFLNGLVDNTNYTYTENGAVTHRTTKSDLLDLFAFGGAYRKRADDDVILLFKNAFEENPEYAVKCLFYLRDIRGGGQGERRFFRVCLKWLAENHPEVVLRNLEYVPLVGRWDDLYVCFDSEIKRNVLLFIKTQLALDMNSDKAISLLAKWLPSENASSAETKRLAGEIRRFLDMTHKQYRKTLSILRERIKVLEKLMSENRWDEIEFDKIPSVAGFKYRNAFARRDILKERYKSFLKDENTTVNADALYPYQIVSRILEHGYFEDFDETERLALDKYWNNLADYFNEKPLNGIAVVDVSGSMVGTPMSVAISLGLYCAEKQQGPFGGHFITFSQKPTLERVNGIDICQKVRNLENADWGFNTNIEAVFDLLLATAIETECDKSEIPENLIIISDMEFDVATGARYGVERETLLEGIKKEWESCGYTIPHLVFWNVDARNNNIPIMDTEHCSFVSGFSPVLFEQVLEQKSAYELMMSILDKDRYKDIK